MKIDAHQHFWDRNRFRYDWLEAPPLEPIRRNYLPEDLEPHLRACGIDRSIFVQTRHNLDETRWVLELCEQHPFLAGVVGWVDLAAPDCEAQLLECLDHPKFVGVRHITQDEPDENFIIRPDILTGLKVLEKHRVPFDLLFFVPHLKHAPTVARACPDLPLVIDHLAKPGIAAQAWEPWASDFRAAGKCDNICCKLSGLITEAKWHNWSPQDFRPYLDLALEVFGPERLMFGSDWPVCELSGSYAQTVELIDNFVSQLSSTEQALIWGETAREFYRLE